MLEFHVDWAQQHSWCKRKKIVTKSNKFTRFEITILQIDYTISLFYFLLLSDFPKITCICTFANCPENHRNVIIFTKQSFWIWIVSSFVALSQTSKSDSTTREFYKIYKHKLWLLRMWSDQAVNKKSMRVFKQ